MTKIGHDLFRYCAVALQQFGANIKEGDPGCLGEIGQQPVYVGDMRTARVIGFLFSREYRHENDPRGWRLRPNALQDSPDSFDNLSGSILAGVGGIAGVVRADVDHDNPRAEAIQFAVVNSPEDILYAIPAEA